MRTDLPLDPAAVLRALRACREAMVSVSAEVTIRGPVDHAASGLRAAIDRMAGYLTGDETALTR